jgi:hypothetical protein
MKKYIFLVLSVCTSLTLMSLGGRRNSTPAAAANINLSLAVGFDNLASTRRCASPDAAYGLSCIGAMVKNAALKTLPSKSDFDIFSSTIVKNRFYGTLKIVNADNISQVLFESSLAALSINNTDGCSLKIPVPSNIRCRVIINILEPCYIYSSIQPCYRTGIARSAWGCDVTLAVGTASKNISLNENNLLNTGLC